MKTIVVKRQDGGVSIICPTHEATPELMERDARAVEGYVSHREIDDDKIPSDRIFRNAWTDDNPTETIDISSIKARQLIREKRNRALESLDKKAFSESRKPNGKTDEIDAEAQRLRDIPQHPDFSSDNIEKLKALMQSINEE